MLTNAAYGEVKLEPGGGGEGDALYEDPDKLASTGQRKYEPTRYRAACQSTTSHPTAPVYATADETTS